jgi:Transcriptional regulators
VRLLTEAGMPFACFGRTGPALPQNWVDIDNRGAVAAAVEHVLARGFGRIAFAGYRTPNSWDTERVAGFRDGLAAAGISANQADMLLVDDGNAHRKIRSLLSAGRPGLRPDAIVTGSDRLAGVIYSVAAELRLRIGRDLAVTGFDGSAAAALMHPRLTTVAIPVDDIAGRVVDRALRQVDHGPDQQPGEVVPASLRLGESTGGFGPEPDRAALTEPDDAALTWNVSKVRQSPGVIAVSPSRTWPPTPGWASARSRACSTEATRCASPRCGPCSTRSNGSATGRATPRRPWSAVPPHRGASSWRT